MSNSIDEKDILQSINNNKTNISNWLRTFLHTSEEWPISMQSTLA